MLQDLPTSTAVSPISGVPQEPKKVLGGFLLFSNNPYVDLGLERPFYCTKWRVGAKSGPIKRFQKLERPFCCTKWRVGEKSGEIRRFQKLAQEAKRVPGSD